MGFVCSDDRIVPATTTPPVAPPPTMIQLQNATTTSSNEVHESDRPAPATIQPNGGAEGDTLQVPTEAKDRSNEGIGGLNLDSTARWQDAAIHARGKVGDVLALRSSSVLNLYQIGQKAALEGQNDVRSRWKRAVFLANRLANGRGVVTSAPKYDVNDPAAQTAKILETQHWLEMIDPKHRYGSNSTHPYSLLLKATDAPIVKYYFRTWSAEDTKQNFFQWYARFSCQLSGH